MRWTLLLLAAACATSGSRYGTVALKSGANATARPVNYSVGRDTISSQELDATVSDGCVRGSIRGTPLQFCRDANDPTHWTGASGDFTARALEGGQAVQVSGWMLVSPTRRIQMDQTVPLGSGSQWDELRRNPELLAIAATAADLRAAHIPR